MNSIQLVRFLDAMKVTEYRHAQGVVPRSVVIFGRDFNSVESVVINSSPSPSFLVVDNRTILAAVPPQFDGSAVESVAVLGSSIDFADSSIVELTLGTRPRKVSGKASLVQTFLRMLLRAPGTNLFHPQTGGGLFSVIGSQFEDHGSLVGAVSTAVSRAARSVITAQAGNRLIPASERLLAATLLGVEKQDDAQNSIAARVHLVAHDGEQSGATIIT